MVFRDHIIVDDRSLSRQNLRISGSIAVLCDNIEQVSFQIRMVAMQGEQKHAFISYSRRNIDVMRRLAHMLRESGIPVWTDERLTAGTPSWKNSIENALQGAFCVIVLMSPTAKTSEWVERELDYAYMLQLPIFPVLIEGSQRDAVPFEIINMQYVDARADLDQGLQQIVSLLAPNAVVSLDKPDVFAMPVGQPIGQQPAHVPDDDLPANQVRMSSAALDGTPLGFGYEDEDTERAVKSRTHFRRIVAWYFLSPRKFRLFSAIVTDSSARSLHAVLMMFAYLWILGISSFMQLVVMNGNQRNPNPTGNLFILAIACYGIVMLVPMAAPYKSRRAFFGSIGSSVLLLVVLSILIGIVGALLFGLSSILEGA